MNTYYLWYRGNDGRINIGSKITHGYESKFLVQVDTNGLDAAINQLIELSKKHGKKRRLEIHCHGDSAKLHLGADGAVSNYNVKTFALSLKQVLVPNGFIEVLACSVANQNDEGAIQKAPKNQIQGYREDYHGALRLRRSRRYYHEARFRPPMYGGGFAKIEDRTQDDPKIFFAPKPETDGLKFCLDLAINSGCTVRAAVEQQRQEGELFGSRLTSPIGNWEYEVFDFQPDGKIQFLGTSPYRDPINGFDIINKIPTA